MLRSLLALVLAAGCHGSPTVERRAPAGGHPVVPTAISAPGVVEPWLGEVQMASAEAGQIAAIVVVEGQRVAPGELLARLEDSRERHAVAIAEAELEEAAAQLAATAADPAAITRAEAEVSAARARAEQEVRDSERAAALGGAGALAAAEVERSAAARRGDEARLAAARAALMIARRGSRGAERDVAAARHAAAAARLDDAHAALARREVRSPKEAVVLWSRRHPGEFVAPDRGPLLVLGDLRRLQVRLEVDDGDAALLRPDTPCVLRDDGGARLGHGRVARLGFEYGSRSLVSERPTARSDARVREVFVEAAAGSSLVPGQRVWADCPRPPAVAVR